ncbi:hypothetical protein PF010_g9534 [Phytophthora fragariae]|uniref:Uncharacterized protein n=1 Tax=Phytophthora fragariae TaxID=53985 RepID=A0A6G0LC84_9STRA|nr:hypothetical protein PF010_g9534 [Phytophthora fragariae]KAE9235475.1 hypothetical protein PF004_g9098 [Phytophthora fragariae]
MQVEEQRQDVHVHVGLQSGGRRAYVSLEVDRLSLRDEKQTQTELVMVATGKTRFVTPQIVLSCEEATDSPYAKAFAELCKRIRSPIWASSLLVVLGHDPEKHRDDLERKIRQDEAAEAIDTELREFFDSVLAPSMQERETAIVNTIHECVQQEILAKELVTQTQQQRLAQLTQQIEEWEKQVGHLKAKVDRRVAENNALRKEQYRQLLMLRDIVSKQGTEPGALSALNEAIATVLAGKQQIPTPEIHQSSNDSDQGKASGRGLMSVNANVQALHREKDKWEQRAKEASVECEGLRDKIAQLTQQNMTYRATESVPWFLKPQSAIAERQRIADAVCSYQSNWEEIGDSIVELLNNDILWTAVEQSARRGGKRRVSRGLEAALAQLDSCVQPSFIEEEAASERGREITTPQLGRRRSTFTDLGRLIPCKACHGIGYINADKGDASANDTDSYLRKTLEQVLELKTQLDKANTKALTLEGQLQLSHMHSEQLQEKIQQAELVKTSAVDSCLQTDLDEEEGLDLDEIMCSAYGQDAGTADASPAASRQKRRNTQYDHLIVELKSTLAVKDEGLIESRRALDVAQERTTNLQRALQKEKEAHAEELAMLKSSLAFSLKTGNSKIEERQAAVKLLMKKFSKKSPQPPVVKQSSAVVLPPMNEVEDDKESDESDEDHEQQVDSCALPETTLSEQCSKPNELKRMEALAQRYAEDIIRVRKEHETQQELLKKAEAEIAEEDEKRGRTNSISLGSLVVSMASHPRDLFKALSTAQADILKLRRASQRSSALQTDRLLTLTTHLGHMSEELCTLRKRNLAELEFWKLECEKLQNTNKALETERQIYRKQLQETHNQDELGDSSSKTCSMCESHKKRLMQISNQLLNQTEASRSDSEVEVPAPSALTASERKLVSSVLMDLENIYAGMTSAKQQLARELVATHLGSALRPRSTRRTALEVTKAELKVLRSNNQSGKDGGSPVSTRSAGNSPNKSFASLKASKSNHQLKKTGGEVLDGKQKPTGNPSRPNPAITTMAESDAEETRHGESAERGFESHHRKTLVQEILEGGGFSLTKFGLRIDKPTPEIPEIDTTVDKKLDPELDNKCGDANTARPVEHSSDNKSFDRKSYEFECTPALEFDEKLTLQIHGQSLMNDSSDIRHEPEIIDQLRFLINTSAAAKERVAVTRWQILVCRILCLTCEQRLEQLMFAADRRAEIHPDGTLRPANRRIANVCAIMAQMVQRQRVALETAMAAQELSRRDLKRAEAQLIHGVAMLLDNLSRKGKPTIELRELFYLSQGGSPRRSPTSNRPLYPSTKSDRTLVKTCIQVAQVVTGNDSLKALHTLKGTTFRTGSSGLRDRVHFTWCTRQLELYKGRCHSLIQCIFGAYTSQKYEYQRPHLLDPNGPIHPQQDHD